MLDVMLWRQRHIIINRTALARADCDGLEARRRDVSRVARRGEVKMPHAKKQHEKWSEE